MIGVFDAIVTAEDVHRGRPDPECYLYAAQQIQRPPLRCVVVGNSNQVLFWQRLQDLCVATWMGSYGLGHQD